MRRWVERAVIGLNLCPFAKAVAVKGQVRYSVSRATDLAELAAELEAELAMLAVADHEVHDTTLLAIPGLLGDFLDFNDFLGEGDRLVESMGLAGEIQLASFHPHYRFAGTAADDISNATNRSPWPALHLLREESIDRAVASFPDAAQIYGRNMEVLEKLGAAGWDALGVGATKPGHPP